jgi:putative DNA primase/helicase
LKPLARLAERYSVAIILVTHLTKNGSANSVHRMIGSIGFAGAARSVWMVAKDKADPKRRLLLLAKCNVAPDQGGLAYSIVDGSIAWEAGSVNESADDVLAAENREGDGGDDCNDNDTWLRAELADFQEHPVADLRKAVNEAGLNWRNVQRAASRLKVKRERSGFGGGFIWRLPKPA